MKNSVVTYETQHGSAKKAAGIIADKLGARCINVDTPFEAEDLSNVDNLILVFNFRGPYTAQLTKLYLNRVKEQLTNINVYLVGEGLFSEQEFPVVAEEISKMFNCKSFKTFFVKGQLRIATLTLEEQALLKKFSEITGMQISDMGEFDTEKAASVAQEIYEFAQNNVVVKEEKTNDNLQTKWVCPVCGHVHYGEMPPQNCPLCGVPGSMFVKQ